MLQDITSECKFCFINVAAITGIGLQIARIQYFLHKKELGTILCESIPLLEAVKVHHELRTKVKQFIF